MLPRSLESEIQRHLKAIGCIHEQDLAVGYGQVQLPDALARRYPNASTEWRWQWVFPQANGWRNLKTGDEGRHHLDPSLVQRAVRDAVLRSGIDKCASCYIFRHSFATHLLQSRYDTTTVQEPLEHRDVRTTVIYTHVLNQGAGEVVSPLNRI